MLKPKIANFLEYSFADTLFQTIIISINRISDLSKTKMKFYLLVITLFYCNVLFAKPVNETIARKVAYNFSVKNISSSISENDLLLGYKSEYYDLNNSSTLIVDYYVFNISKNDIKAFIIVSGDDVVLPVLGYSNGGLYESSNLPENASKWFSGYKSQIRYCVNNHIESTLEIKLKWNNLLNPVRVENMLYSISTVAPLIQTKWDQGDFYNEFCPYDALAQKNSYTGCVATAMAQIMKYWNYPLNGSGFKSYSHNTYGTLSANFGGTSYSWSAMPSSLYSSNNEVAKLMYHCGVSVSMNYGPTESGAYVVYDNGKNPDAAEVAFKKYFGYKSTLKGVIRNTYSDIEWLSLLKNELSQNRPILYVGFGSGGHAFIADGYDKNDFLHFNWGWGGKWDAYFLVDQLNPSGAGIGGGDGTFNLRQQAIIGIEPSIPQQFNLQLHSPITSNANPINYGSSFSINTNIANRGVGNFIGDYCAALFDTGYTFVDYVEIKSSQNLQANNYYVNGLKFSSVGSLKYLPGEYYIGIYYRETGGNWIQIKGGNGISNSLKVKFSSASNIELYSNIYLSPSNILTRTQSTNVNLNLKNNGTSKFLGDYQINLYKLDGTFAETINSFSETNGLNIGYSYQSPFLNFYTPSVKSSPGSYLLAAIHKSTSSANWSLTGSTYFSNPIKVIVKNPDLIPDKYEINDKMSNAYTLPVSFSNNKSTINTSGANFHDGADRDLFKINLPVGSKYLISAKVYDAYNPSNGVTYSGDAQFAYTIYSDSSKWSASYDDVMPSDIVLNDGGIVYFNVWQFFPGTTGDYFLDINISKFNGSIFNPLSDTLTVCSDSKILDAGSGYSNYLWNTGETTQKITIKSTGKYYVSVNNNTPFISSDTTNIVLINNKISQNDTTICEGTLISLSVSKNSTSIFQVGDKGPAGGYIIYDKGAISNGWRYIEAAPVDASAGIGWWNGNFILTGTVNWAVGNSIPNTDLIIAKQGLGTYAATVAKSYRGGGFSDWNLPSLDELRLIYTGLKKKGVGDLNSDFYWSSSEFNVNAAYRINFSNNGIEDGGWKNYTNGAVRPVRYFSGNDSVDFLWSTGDTSHMIQVQPNKSTPFNVKLQKGKSFCLDTIQVNVIRRPIVNFSYDTRCVNVPVLFNNISDTATSVNIKWTWKSANTLFSNLTNTSISFNKSGSYPITLIAKNTICSNQIDSITKVINIVSPFIGVRYNVINAKKNINTSLRARYFGINYLWLPGKFLTDSTINNPFSKSDKEIDYKVIIKDSAGCTTVDSQLVRIFDKYSVFVPTAFSPDGNGINDYLRPILVGIKEIKSFRIYSRWGNLLYQTKDVSIGWDGTFNGQKMPTDTYIWVFEGFDLDGNPILLSGKTTLIR